MSWGQLGLDVDAMRQLGPVVKTPYLGGFKTRDLAQITDDMIAWQESGFSTDGLALPPVFTVIRLIASTVDQLDLTVDDGPLPRWLAQPRREGGALDLGDLIQWLVTSMALQGAGYLLCTKKSGDSWRLDALHPGSVAVQPSTFGVVTLTYRVGADEYQTPPASMRDVPLGARFVLPVPYLITPQYPQGVSPLTACRLSLYGYASVERESSSLIDRGTYSGGRLETDQDITETTARRYQDQWTANRREGKLPVLGAGLRYVNDLSDPSDAQWLESRQYNAQQIAALFGVPMDYVGMTMIGGSSSLSYTNAQDNDRRFRRNCLEAFTSQIEDALSLLTPPGRTPDEAQQVRFDYSGWEASGNADTANTEPVDAS